MIRVMLVDDEKIVIDALSFIINKNFDNVQVVATARSGREAIEIVENFVPDLVFMDIRMPGINGIDAIREIKSRYKDIIFVILTAFEQFDFAKEAVNLGVLEYLLKPVNKLKVIEVVKRSIDLIEEQRKRRHKELGMKEKLENLIPILESGFINAITNFSENHNEITNYLNIFDINDYSGYIMTLEFFQNENIRELQSKLRVINPSHNIHDFIKNQVQAKCRCIVGPVMVNRVVIFVQNENIFEENCNEDGVILLAETLLNKLSKNFNYCFKIGIGNIYNNFEGFSFSFAESLQALKSLRGAGIMHFKDIKEHFYSEFNLFRYNKIGDIIKNAKEYIEANYHKPITLDEVSREVSVSSQYLSKLFKLEMKENFIDYLTTIRIEKAKSFLEEGKLTIKQISYKIGYSDPNYFSRIFKKVVGISPTEYKK